MADLNIDELLKILPQLIRENDTVKGAILSALSGVVATHDDVVELGKVMDKRFEETNRRFEEMRAETAKQFAESRAETNRRFEEILAETANQFTESRAETSKQFSEIHSEMHLMMNILQNLQTQLGKPFKQC